MPEPRPDDLLRTPEAASHLQMSYRTLERYRVTGEGPRYFKVGRRVLYRRSVLDEWLETRVRRSTSDPGPDDDNDNDDNDNDDNDNDDNDDNDDDDDKGR